MIALVGYDFTQIALGILFVSLSLLVITIAYKKLLQYLGKGAVNKQDFCVLYPLDENPAKGTVQFYFTSDEPKKYALWILNPNMEEQLLVKEDEATSGGTIVRFDTSVLTNGHYFFCLKTENQKTMKKMQVYNA